MDHATEIKNPLLETYGAVVDGFFAPGTAIHSPIFIFPGIKSASQVDELPYKPDLVHFDPGHSQLQAIQETVQRLRQTLEEERKEHHQTGNQRKKFDNIADRVRAVRGQAEGIQQLSFHLESFRKALKTWDESLLQGNPFYTLTRLIFKHNIDGTIVLLKHLQTDLAANAPDSVQSVRSLRQIWTGPRKMQDIPAKIIESLGGLFKFSKIFLEIILFSLSTFATHQAVSTLLHRPNVIALLEKFFSPSQADLLQFMLSALGGILLTLVVLDFKAKLFRGIAESGAVASGLRATVEIHPRWIVIASLLVLLSIKTNYDSISPIFSKKEFLSEQLENIHKKVESILGNPEKVNPTTPQSLYDLQAFLATVGEAISQKFSQVPEDELSGKDPRKGPRYYGKYFLINGGFELGVNDVAHMFRNVQFSRNMDQTLKESGLVLDLPFSQKMAQIVKNQALAFNKSTKTVHDHLAALDQLMQVGSFSPATVQKILTFDTTQINFHLQAISEALATNRKQFDSALKAMDVLSATYIKIIAQIDHSDDSKFQTLRVQERVATLQLPSSDLLLFDAVSMENERSFFELAAFMTDRFGHFYGKFLMGLILFLAIAIDLLPLLLFSRKTAQQGLADSHVFSEMLSYMKDWEDAFVELTKSFFYRPAIQQILRGLTFPNETGVRNAFFKLLEEINAEVKDIKDLSAMEQNKTWFLGLFFQTRSINITGYNARAEAIETLLTHNEIYFPKLIKLLFPGFPYEKKSGKNLTERTFLQLYQEIEIGQANDKELFSAELRGIGRGGLVVETDGTDELHGRSQWMERLSQHFSVFRGRLKLPFWGRKNAAVDPWTMMVHQAISNPPSPSHPLHAKEDVNHKPATLQTFWYTLFERGWREPFPTFPHTRRNWLIEMSSVDEKSLEDLDTLHDFIPDFVKMLKKVLTNTLPIIQESLDPLDDIYARFPGQCNEKGIVITSHLKDRFKEIEKESLGLWGACVSHLLGEDSTVNSLHQKLDVSGLAGVLANGGDISKFYDRIHTLMSDARSAAQQAKGIEEAAINAINGSIGEIKVLCDDVNQMLIKINILSLELRRRRPLPHFKLRGLNEGSALLERAPRHARTLLEAREKILSSRAIYTDENYNELLQLKSQAQALHSRVDNILNLVDK